MSLPNATDNYVGRKIVIQIQSSLHITAMICFIATIT